MAREHRIVNDLIAAVDKELAFDLRTLRDARNQADYDLTIDHEVMTAALKTMRSLSITLIERLEHLRSDAER